MNRNVKASVSACQAQKLRHNCLLAHRHSNPQNTNLTKRTTQAEDGRGLTDVHTALPNTQRPAAGSNASSAAAAKPPQPEASTRTNGNTSDGATTATASKGRGWVGWGGSWGLSDDAVEGEQSKGMEESSSKRFEEERASPAAETESSGVRDDAGERVSQPTAEPTHSPAKSAAVAEAPLDDAPHAETAMDAGMEQPTPVPSSMQFLTGDSAQHAQVSEADSYHCLSPVRAVGLSAHKARTVSSALTKPHMPSSPQAVLQHAAAAGQLTGRGAAQEGHPEQQQDVSLVAAGGSMLIK